MIYSADRRLCSNMRRAGFAIAMLLAIILFSASALGQSHFPPGDLYVDDDAPPGGDGYSWETAFCDLVEALAAAREGWTIHIAGGTYAPAPPDGSRFATFKLKNSLTLLGGYAGVTEPYPDYRDIDLFETILTGDLNGDDEPNFINYDENVYHVVTADYIDVSVTLDGLTITGGNADLPGDENWLIHRGAGVHAYYGAVSLANCWFHDNRALLQGGFGGGIWASHYDLTVVNCVFQRNEGGMGGALAHADGELTIVNSSFQDNTGWFGGAVNTWSSDALISGCEFSGNYASQEGGALQLYNESFAIVVNSSFSDNECGCYGGAACNIAESDWLFIGCRFTDNHAEEGGAMFNAGDSSSTVVACEFLCNSAVNGGAVRNFAWPETSWDFANCLFMSNSADEFGGAVDNDAFGPISFTNCTFTQNTAARGGAQSAGVGTSNINCIFWDNSATIEGDEISGSPVTNYCLIEGGWPGEGNIDADPMFVDAESGDLHLLPGSPCIDAGDNTALPEETLTDLDGNDRFVDDPTTPDTGAGEPPIVDMGAYEFRLGDINHDNAVDADDLISLTEQWGPCAPGTHCTADLNASGTVDVSDLLLLLGQWD